MGLTVQRAPDLPDWLAPELPFDRYVAVIRGHRVHFVDHAEGPAVLMVHGNPTWCFLWRKVIEALDGKVRVIAPDLVGFGLSDKPRRPSAQRLEMHVDTMLELVDGLGLDRLVLVGQDMGGPVATGIGWRDPSRAAGLVLGNTAVLRPRRPLSTKAFHRLSQTPVVSDLVFRGLGLPHRLLHRVQGDPASMDRVARRAYRWPFRRLRNRAGPLGMARMVPNSEDHPSTAVMDEIGGWVESFEGPAALVWGVRDPILGRGLRRHSAALPQAGVTETQAGHFLQEEVAEELAAAVLAVVEQA